MDVEGEVLDGDLARGPVNPVRQPNHFSREIHDHIRVDDRVVVVGIGAEKKGKETRFKKVKKEN